MSDNFRIFAAGMMRMKVRRMGAALLLAVLLPAMVVSPFHHHEAAEKAEVACDLCAHHQPHSGHLTSSGHIDDCLVCQFLGTCFVPSETVSAPSVSRTRASQGVDGAISCLSACVQLLSTRAPPACC